MDDNALLRQFAENQSDEAFGALVTRHVNLVYSVALRQVGQPHDAEEITQAVFIILAKKAAGLRHEKALTSWLFLTTRLTANNFVRSEMRRRHREQEAYMQSVLDESAPDVWPKIAPLLDNAVAGLREKDRQALLLRFYEGRNLREIGAVLGATEEAAEKRVSRALEKLRKLFARRGVDSSAAAIAESVSANSVQTAPAALAKAVTAVAISKGATVSVSTLTLIKGALKIMAWTKAKTAIITGAAILLAGVAAFVSVKTIHYAVGDYSRQAFEIIQKSQDAYAALSSYSDNGIVTQDIGSQVLKTTFNIRLQRPDFYRIEWSQATRFFTNGGIVWSSGQGNFLMMKNGQYEARPQKYANMQAALAAATGISGQASLTIPAAFFNQNRGDVLNPANATLRKSEGLNGVDCYVVSRSTGPTTNQGKTVQKMTVTLWIGKEDYLIHQIKTVMEGTTFKQPTLSDATIRKLLQAQHKPATPETIAAARAKLAATMKSVEKDIKGGPFTFTQTHENISVNQKFLPSDFEQ